MSKKVLIVVRHAHRSKKQGREVDNGLSAQGRKQARALSKLLKKHLDGEKPVLFSSPFRRCVETLAEVKQKCGGALRTSELLSEEAAGKGAPPLERRVRAFCSEWRKSKSKLTIVCSHGDWIPLCVEILTGSEVWLEKGGWLQIEIEDRKPMLTWLVQDSGEI